ncbi:hypothetical protein KSF_098790 [Reticulibacter mediterranei]|uniref:Uncharacterized protein n=1 Tax=Reticulibacter mediterranei TaxID=2778369 RepID=A0A8J3J305_9CHLR|nr:hypothetical protein KSF_098790 [Reticulibacter mediterranei]
MIREPSTRLQAVMTAQVVGDNEDIAHGIVRFDLFEQFNVVLGIARCGTSGELFAITDPHCSHLSRPCHPRDCTPAEP